MTQPAQPAAASSSKVQETVELVRRLCTAVVTVEMFPADHPQSRESVGEAYSWLSGMLERQGQPVVISVSGRQIVVEGLPLEDKNPLIAKLAGKLGDIHVKNLFFDPATTAEEFQGFYRILGRGARYINEHGGIGPMLEEAKLEHIHIRDVSYVMVTEDQKVVSREARVVEEGTLTRAQSDAEIAQYLAGAILKRAEEQQWMLTEMKDNPRRMAELITEGINLASARSDTGADSEATIEALMNNIRLVGRNLVDEETGEVKDGQEDLEHSILRLENEMRLRSQRLTSSKVMSGFINEVLALVTSYSDRVRAKRICNEFLKDERSLKQTEKLLKQLAPTEEPKDCVERMRQLLVRGGVTEKALAEWLDGTAKKRAGAARPRPRRRAPAAVAEGITKRLAGLALDSARAQALTDDLSAFVEQRARERSADILEQVEDLRGSVSRRDRTLEGLAQGVVLWGSEGKVEYANATARRALGADAVPDLHPELRRALRELRFPLADPEPLASRAGLGQADVHLLMSIAAVLTEGEEPYAVLFVV